MPVVKALPESTGLGGGTAREIRSMTLVFSIFRAAATISVSHRCELHRLVSGWCSDQELVAEVPNGRTYTTRPGSRIFILTWNTTRAELPHTPTPTTTIGDRAVMMPPTATHPSRRPSPPHHLRTGPQ
jgi:hypothetical protein